MPFDHWRKRLAIAEKYSTVAERRAAVAALKINFSQPQPEDEGYYRKPVTQKDPSGNGKTIIVDWIPVAYFVDNGNLVGVVGSGDAREPLDEELWSWVVANPISYETYQAVAERGEPWPDLAEPKNESVAAIIDAIPAEARAAIAAGEHTEMPPIGDSRRVPAANRQVNPTDNQPPAVLPEIEHATAIDNAIGAAPSAPFHTAEAAEAALGSKNRIAELRLAASKVGKARYEPLHVAYVAERNKWLPMIGRAEEAEKRLNIAILSFRESERKRLAKIAAEEAAKQREIDEANERAAQRAIARGEPEATPEPPAPEAAAVPQPAPLQPTYGTRKIKEEMKTILDAITDYDAVYQFLKSDPDVKALLLKLATAKVKAGFTVPGTTTREGLI